MSRLLFIEDEKDFAKLVVSYLEKRGFVVCHVLLGKKGLEELKKNLYDLVILDLRLPDQDGLELCKKIREKDKVPILVLTAKDAIFHKVSTLNAGADDYLVKPVSLKELVVRIENLLGRNLKGKFRSSVFEFGGIKFDTVGGILTSKSKALPLTKKEKAVLEYLLLKQGQVLTRMEIMDNIWGEDIDAFSNTVNMVIVSLRKKLKQFSNKNFIHSVHGLGYKFKGA